jgi:hypothetical protein
MEPDRITEPQLADALKGLVAVVEDGEEGTEGKLRHPAGIARDVFYLIFRSGPRQQPWPAADPAPVRFEDAEVDALAVMVDRMAVLRSETDEVTVQRVIRYLCDRYGTDGA